MQESEEEDGLPPTKRPRLGFGNAATVSGVGVSDKRRHVCSPDCLRMNGNEPLDFEALSRHSLFVRPVVVGFERVTVKRNAGLKVVDVTTYFAPCRQPLRDMKRVHAHLLATGAQLGVDCFTFVDRPLNKHPMAQESGGFYSPDITAGQERIPISCVNEVDDALPLADGKYIADRAFHDSVPMVDATDFSVCCSCDGDCSDSANCECQLLTRSLMEGSDEPGKIYAYRRLKGRILSGIFECNSKCKCNRLCFNRVAQQTLSVRLQLFRTLPVGKGWGVRCLHDLPAGTFVSRYDGLVVSDRVGEELGKRSGDTYLLDLDFIERNEKEGYEEDVKVSYDSEPTPCVRSSSFTEHLFASNLPLSQGTEQSDGTHRHFKLRRAFFNESGPYVIGAEGHGNIGMFFNHSCEPNMFVQNVFFDTHDPRFPRIAFFTSHYVPAGEELTWDYGYKVGSVKGTAKLCLCEAESCRKRLL